MTLQAFAVSNALRVEDSSNGVRRMAIHTCRKYVSFLFPQFTTDHLLVDSFDLHMTRRTCGGNVLPCDRRPGIGMGKDEVRRMAGREG